METWDSPPTAHGYKGGDLLGVVEHLDWICELGIDALYLNPIFRSASNHRYHTHDYYTVDPLLGGDEAFEELLEACHRRGLRVVLDGVFNHAGRGFFQFNDILENGRQSPWLDWFTIRGWPLRAYDHDQPPNYRAWWNLHALPTFNTDNPQVREYLLRVAEHWVEKGIDGWRLDVPMEIDTPGFWEEFRERVRRRSPQAYLVGEIWRDAGSWISAGDRFDGTMNYLFTGPTLAFTAGSRIDRKVVEGVPYRVSPPLDAAGYGDAIGRLLALYPEPAHQANLNLLGSHDTPRVISASGGDRRSVVLAALLLFTFPGAPCIYYGDEIGLPGGRDPGCRASFPWASPESWDTEILEAFRSLIALRRSHSALRTGAYRPLWPPSRRPGGMLYVFLRESGQETLLVAVNAGTGPETATLRSFGPQDHLLVWGKGRVEHQGVVRVTVPPRTGAVWEVS
ncbi:MAG: glycoside hydrolase family 13 protein [Actinomycetota bacterium]|nr:glycoside hydrolase family 13 protein [Actinomycetota bacterium]